jgi:hypothetical protein
MTAPLAGGRLRGISLTASNYGRFCPNKRLTSTLRRFVIPFTGHKQIRTGRGVSMKRPVSLVASLVSAVILVSGCGAAKVGKTEFADICMKRMGNQQAKCSCYVDTIQASLTPEQFTTLVQGAYEVRDLGGSSWLPAKVQSDPTISDALNKGTKACFDTRQAASR